MLVCLWENGTSPCFYYDVVLYNTWLEPQLRTKRIVVQYEDFDVTVAAQTPSQGLVTWLLMSSLMLSTIATVTCI